MVLLKVTLVLQLVVEYLEITRLTILVVLLQISGCDTLSLLNLFVQIAAIEIAQRRYWNHLWLKYDSKLVTPAFKFHLAIPWKLINCWNNYLLWKEICILQSIIFSGKETTWQKLANLGLEIIDSL
jgi:hypothetical protein